MTTSGALTASAFEAVVVRCRKGCTIGRIYQIGPGWWEPNRAYYDRPKFRAERAAGIFTGGDDPGHGGDLNPRHDLFGQCKHGTKQVAGSIAADAYATAIQRGKRVDPIFAE